MDATIVIASLNESANLARTIQSCLDTTDGLDYEIVVADDSSADGSIDELATQHPGVRIVRHERRQGVASTKDLGARSASGDVLVFLDGHCKPEPGAIARLVDDVRELDGRAVITAATAAAARTRSARRRARLTRWPVHRALRVLPAIEAGGANQVWSVFWGCVG